MKFLILSANLMMITFIAMNSGLVPLIEGLCTQILYFRFEIIGGLRSHLLLFFFGRKNMIKKIPPPSIYMHMCTLYTYTNDDDCFYYHSWRNNVVIEFGTLSSFLT